MAALVAILASLSASGAAFVAALAPFLKFEFLKPYWPLLTRADGDIATFGGFCLALSVLLSVVTAAGRSIVSDVDAGPVK